MVRGLDGRRMVVLAGATMRLVSYRTAGRGFSYYMPDYDALSLPRRGRHRTVTADAQYLLREGLARNRPGMGYGRGRLEPTDAGRGRVAYRLTRNLMSLAGVEVRPT